MRNYTIISSDGMQVSGGRAESPAAAIAKKCGGSTSFRESPTAIRNQYCVKVKVGGYWRSVVYRDDDMGN